MILRKFKYQSNIKHVLTTIQTYTMTITTTNNNNEQAFGPKSSNLSPQVSHVWGTTLLCLVLFLPSYKLLAPLSQIGLSNQLWL